MSYTSHLIYKQLFFILILCVTLLNQISAQQTFRDEFNAVSYTNTDGTQDWSGNAWAESGDDNSPSGGYIYITSNQLRMDYIWSETISRTADLTGATAATLSFDYTTNSLGAQRQLGILLSNNGGASYTQIATLSGSGSFSQDISAYISNNTTISFAKSNQDWQSNDWAQLDNVQISANIGSSVSIDDVAVSENAGSAVFTITHTGSDASGAFSVNYSITAVSATQGTDYTTGSGLYTGTLNFNGTAGDTEQITVLITDDFDVESNETYTIQFTSTTDPSINITDTATGTINNDDVAAVIQVSDVAVDENLGPAVFTVNHTGGSRPAAFTVDYTITAVSATEGTDYTTGSGLYTGTLNFNGTTGDSETITVQITDDTEYETAETYTISFTATTDTQVNITDTATGTINDDEVILNDVALSLYDDFQGNFDYVLTGGTFRTNDDATDPCSITTTSSGNLTTILTPAGKTIKKAYLYWAHSSTVLDQDVTLEGQNVSADLVYGAFTFGAQFYGYIADVTDVVTGLADPWGGTYDFTNLTIDNTGTYCSSTVVLGAWSLMIFYEDFSLPTSTINLYYGFDATQNNGTSFTLDNFYAISPIGSKATFLSYEGDASLDGTVGSNKEELSILPQGGGTPNILTGDGGQTGNNPFNSTIYDNTSGVNTSGIYGLDLDTYDISSFISITDTQVTANVDMSQDLVISSAVVLRVPSNIISGTVFEDINYPGGSGRNMTTASGVGIPNVTVELYDNLGALVDTETTDADGEYAFGGISDGTYTVRVANSSINSTRGGGSTCGTCYAVQTFRSDYDGTTLNTFTDEIGGNFPSSEDVAIGTLTGAQTTSTVVVLAGGTGGIDFGFNFNTIVNTNEDGQGSLGQFIVNSNNLDETGLDIETNAIFDPAAGEDTSIFMIPPTSDPFGRTADSNFGSGYFDILISAGNPLSDITANNTIIDGRTQTAYSGDTNTGTIGSGGTTVGTSAIALPNYNLPEIQVHRDLGDVFITQGNNVTIRNLAIYANINAGIRIDAGALDITQNLIGVNATGTNAGDINFGIENAGGNMVVDGNYIATTTESAVLITSGTSNTVQNNHFANNGNSACDDAITLTGGSGITIQQNLIEGSASTAIDGALFAGGATITENSITTSGQDGGNCGGNVEDMGVKLAGNNSQLINNIIFSNGGAGIVVMGGTGNLISQNSIYANGTSGDALGIDLDASTTAGDDITLNDNGDSDSGPNNLLNFPILNTIFISGSNLIVTGWSRPGATLEFFLTDISAGSATDGDNQLGLSTDYGEGQTFIASVVEGSGSDSDATSSAYSDADGNVDTTNRFKFTIPFPSATLSNKITATATLGNSTSEFSPVSKIKVSSVITNRKITYRVNRD
ncbi:beta strand repeat-containing protein [Flagellimonas sp.]|uniref:beta strand repeat-containing protein n=1 Tax=Flagellimonas sp. TaxID=2058762 RepID=UPI003B5CC6AE